MNLYIGTILVWIMLFPSLFSWSAPFVYIGFAGAFLTRSIRIGKVFDPRIMLGFFLFILLGFFLIITNFILFNDFSPWTYWIAGYSTWFFIIILIRSVKNVSTTIHNVLVIVGFVASIANLLFIFLFLTGIITDSISIPGYQAYFGIDSRGFFAYSTSQLPLYSVLVPYFSYKAANCPGGLLFKEKVLMAMMVVAGVLSLKSFVFLTFISSFFYYCLVTGRIKFFVKTIFCICLIVAFLVWKFGFGYEALSGIYELKWMGKVSGEDRRYQQIVFWLKSFWDSPLIGHGVTSAELIIYDIATGELLNYRPGPVVSPYGYEILYGRLLSDIGMIFFVYAALFIKLIFFTSAYSPLKWQVQALRIAAFYMILQSGTNSYLLTSGWLVVLMLPMAFITSKNRLRQYANS